MVTVNGWWTDYKKAAPSRARRSTHQRLSNATATAAPADTGKTVIVLVDGLNFRENPDATGVSIRGLKKGETFILVSQSGSWLADQGRVRQERVGSTTIRSTVKHLQELGAAMVRVIGNADEFWRLRITRVDTTQGLDFEWHDDILVPRAAMWTTVKRSSTGTLRRFDSTTPTR